MRLLKNRMSFLVGFLKAPRSLKIFGKDYIYGKNRVKVVFL